MDESNFNKYVASLYWIITTVSTVGYGDIKPANTSERTFCIFVMLGGVFFFSYTIGTISSIIFEYEKKNSSINENMFILQEITRNYKISDKFARKIKESLEYDKPKVKKQQFRMFNSLPRRLALQLNLLINKDLVKNSNKFFQSKPIGFITQILELLKPIKLKSKEILFEKEEFGSEIYFLTKGQVCLFDTYKKIEVTVLVLTDGEFFGEIAVLLEETQIMSCKTLKISEILSLTRGDLLQVTEQFDQLKEKMILQAISRKEGFIEIRENKINDLISNRNLAYTLQEKKFERDVVRKESLVNQKKMKKLKVKLSEYTFKKIDRKSAMINELKLKIHKLNKKIRLFKAKLEK